MFESYQPPSFEEQGNAIKTDFNEASPRLRWGVLSALLADLPAYVTSTEELMGLAAEATAFIGSGAIDFGDFVASFEPPITVEDFGKGETAVEDGPYL